MASTSRSIYMACDGFGEDLKNAIKSHLETKENIDVKDFGSNTYYDAAANVSKAIADGNKNEDATDVIKKDKLSNVGILICGTGMGVGIVANKFPGVRAATCENVSAARCARAVNNANVLCLGQLVTKTDDAKVMVDEFLEQQFNSQPDGEDGTPLNWWSKDVEIFLATSMEGIERVEQEVVKQDK
mmetsp:Transcript_5440/g.6365  ORF Transcript_5440/g.6365 Transcript_5440/m.6365 type:complete len:186 (+) Transcript_5440:30-587(+)